MLTPNNFKIFNFRNLCNLAKYDFLKLPEDVTELSKHVRMNII